MPVGRWLALVLAVLLTAPWTDAAYLGDSAAWLASAPTPALGLANDADLAEVGQDRRRQGTSHQDLALVGARAASARGQESIRPVVLAYPATFAAVVLIVVLVYGDRGLGVVLGVTCYLVANATMKLTVKWVFVHCRFDFPKLVSALHFATSATVALAIMLWRSQRAGRKLEVPTLLAFCTRCLPLAVAVVVSIGATNMALSFCSAGFVEIVGSTGCLSTILMVTLLGMPFDSRLIAPALLVALGCMVSTASDIHYSSLGLVLCLLGNLSRSAKVAMQGALMGGGFQETFEPAALLLWTCAPAAVIMLLASLATEGAAPLEVLVDVRSPGWGGLAGALAVSSLNATALNTAQFFVTKDLGAVGSQLVAQTKGVLTVLGGMAVLSESVTASETLGFAVIMIGVFWYSRMERQAKAEAEAEARLLKLPQREPTSELADARSLVADDPKALKV